MLYANGQPVGGGNANEKSLTLAEYNALSEAEKMSGTTYYITDAVPQGKKIQPVIYSLQEREIGVWTDGKPLYQLTMVFPSNFSINGTGTALPNDMQTALADVDALIDAEVCRDNTIATFISPYVYKSSGTWYVIAFDNWGNCKWITFRYIKTTDTAGSGTWTPQGVPTHHYSMDEHVIGTWIDGSTLYEKTIFTNPTWNNNSTNIQLTNEICKSIEGGVCDANGEALIPFGYASSEGSHVRCYQASNVIGLYNSFSASRDYVQMTLKYTKSS